MNYFIGWAKRMVFPMSKSNVMLVPQSSHQNKNRDYLFKCGINTNYKSKKKKKD